MVGTTGLSFIIVQGMYSFITNNVGIIAGRGIIFRGIYKFMRMDEVGAAEIVQCLVPCGPAHDVRL